MGIPIRCRKNVAGGNVDPNDEWALLKKWEKEALVEFEKEEAKEKQNKVEDKQKTRMHRK